MGSGRFEATRHRNRARQVVDAKETANAVKDFLSKDGPERIFFFYQARWTPLVAAFRFACGPGLVLCFPLPARHTKISPHNVACAVYSMVEIGSSLSRTAG